MLYRSLLVLVLN